MYNRYVLLAQVFTHSTCIKLGLRARPAYLQLQNKMWLKTKCMSVAKLLEGTQTGIWRGPV
jgi:hypothetical protein